MISRTLCCSLWMRVISILETYSFRTRHILTLVPLSTSRTDSFGEPKTHVDVPSSLYSPKVMVWDAISCKRIIGPFFREQTINAAKYLGSPDKFVEIHYALDDHWNASWFMQDGARPHRALAVFDFLSEHFNDRVIALDYDKHTGCGMAWHGMASLFARLDAM
ncbi:hypothetical protein AVEN_146567-1 [Araneus ventricosus]|uniref:Tc1-like transposase DDE domain-containing protein n=1 Tax=Araneus ventricosus TaxID=182803 RepID=A0A4Y2UTP1_ARAVE|nr:hypothetical protein AVEN_146567-1 [Araneus ventricosus]